MLLLASFFYIRKIAKQAGRGTEPHTTRVVGGHSHDREKPTKPIFRAQKICYIWICDGL